jgi:hypothetical protein
MLAAVSGAVATYASFLAILGSAALIGQAIFIACGRRTWTRLSPAVGLAALCPLAWWTVRLPSEGTAAIVAIAIVTVVSGIVVFTLVEGLGGALRRGVPLELCAVVIASLPFIVEGRFGILGTGLNPDMSQHLFAVDRLASGMSERLIDGGYPLGPHSIVIAVSQLGPNTVHAFGGLMLATAVAACLVGFGLLERLAPWRRVAGALVIGFAYLVASYLTQGAFKETMAALFLLAFAVAIDQLATEPRRDRLRAVPLAVLVAGAAYSYSFPGVVWLAAALGAWVVLELARAVIDGRFMAARATVRETLPAALIAAIVAVAALAPEVGRMADFANFETFNPVGAGLGNLFDRLSPLEALGIWPSGDFRIEPGDGAVPAVLFYLGAVIGAAALAYGLAWFWRQRRLALPAAVGAASVLWLYSLIDGTPYQEAKALVLLAAPIAAVSVCGLLCSRVPALVSLAFLAAAGGSAALALANGPVGPANYSAQLAELRENLPHGSIVVLAPDDVLADEHGIDYLSWELRGHRLCIEPESAAGPAGALPAGAAAIVRVAVKDGALVPEGIYANDSATGPGSCPLVADSARADPGANGN